ncbi:hypothetical protein CEXT_756501 [Caerostris extrusa]|uniref:Uncharacterized protein n=1 Tax=Caerostris extrusa TaxID=172846 RepID=A0AAV4UGM1_CAEEX|nr:hypothetical protein CEXT_756501 [Caerostris extrusa]
MAPQEKLQEEKNNCEEWEGSDGMLYLLPPLACSVSVIEMSVNNDCKNSPNFDYYFYYYHIFFCLVEDDTATATCSKQKCDLFDLGAGKLYPPHRFSTAPRGI